MNFSGSASPTADAGVSSSGSYASAPVEPVISVASARLRQAEFDVLRGESETVILRTDGLLLGLVQPRHRERTSLAVATRAAKDDLHWVMKHSGDDTLQGIVYLPHYSRVTRSAAGAMEMARWRLRYEIEPARPRGDRLDHALEFLRERLLADQRARTQLRAFGQALRQMQD